MTLFQIIKELKYVRGIV